jgi:hypothetical protein
MDNDIEITFGSALNNAARLLNNAEMECDLNKMERYEHLADSWVAIAGIIFAKEASV